MKINIFKKKEMQDTSNLPVWIPSATALPVFCVYSLWWASLYLYVYFVTWAVTRADIYESLTCVWHCVKQFMKSISFNLYRKPKVGKGQCSKHYLQMERLRSRLKSHFICQECFLLLAVLQRHGSWRLHPLPEKKYIVHHPFPSSEHFGSPV